MGKNILAFSALYFAPQNKKVNLKKVKNVWRTRNLRIPVRIQFIYESFHIRSRAKS